MISVIYLLELVMISDLENFSFLTVLCMILIKHRSINFVMFTSSTGALFSFLANIILLLDNSWFIGRFSVDIKKLVKMSKKETKTRVANAFRAMKGIGISEDKVKPVLKNLLKLYDKNWELIEEENYRALADAIFEREEAEAIELSKKTMDNAAAVHQKKTVNTEKEDYLDEEAQANEEPERPLKRLRLKYRDGEGSNSNAPHSSVRKMLLVKPKEEPNELPQTCTPKLNASQGILESPQPNAENTRVNAQAVPCQSLSKNKGKRPISPTSSNAREGGDPCQPSGIGRNEQNTTELRSPSHLTRLRDRGTGSASPQVSSREKRLVPVSSSNTECLKEPSILPGIVLSPKKKSIASHALIKPKDEPITDDMPHLEVHIAAIYPDPSNGGDSSSRNGTIREHDSLEPAVSLYVNEKEGGDGSVLNEPRNSGQLAIVSRECSSNLEIASSPFGEVKISLSCNTALGRPDFRMPSLEAVLKSVEEKCLKSSNTLDSNFSVMNLMKEMCQCVLKLGLDPNSESPETLNVTPTIGLLNESSSATADLGAGGLCITSLSGSVDSQFDAVATMSKTPPLPPSRNGGDDGLHLKKMDGGDDRETNRENCTENTNDLSLVVAQQPQVEAPEIIRFLHDVVDIANGREKVVITLANEVSSESPPSFHYIPQNTVFQNAYVNISLACIGDGSCCVTCSGDCLSLSTPCACAQETGGGFAYTTDGLVKEELLEECISMSRDPEKHSQFFCKECALERSKSEDIIEPCKGHLVRKFIKECWCKCGCNKQCGNRVVQRGITRNLQVFMTPEGKGWGLRTLEDLPKGAFICEYVGEVLTNPEFFDRVLRSPKREKYSYSVLLDAGWGAERVLKDEEALCLDATHFGNIARFINHRCYDSSLVEVPVEVETPDRLYYHLAFFTTRRVKAMEELTWDYGIDFDDHDDPIKAFPCQCGSKFCRNLKRSRSRTGR